MKLRSHILSPSVARGIAVMCAGFFVVGAPSTARASSVATITVNDTGDDTTAHDSKCTLREALANVNAAGDTTGGDCAAGTGTGDTIEFNLTLPATITLTTNSELAINRDVIISGPTTGTLLVDGNRHATRVFDITARAASIANLTIQNGGGASVGGGLLVAKAAGVTLTNCTLRGNSAGSGGGGVYIDAGRATLTNCTLSGNFVDEGVGGGLANQAGTATLTNCTLSGNSVGGPSFDSAGGGLFNNTLAMAKLINCTLSGNSAGTGGGLSNNNGARATLTNCTLNDNSASVLGGGVANGGVFNGGTVTLTNCTLNDNSATNAGGGLVNFLTATLTNCTLSGNSATNTGGGFENTSGTATLTNCTLSGNSAGTGGGLNIFGGTATLANTIVANSSTGNCGGVAIVEGGHNLSSDHTCFSTSNSLLNTDPRLAPLADYGGPTETVALCTAVGIPNPSCTGPSPAIDSGDPSVCAATPVSDRDQRNFVRPGSGHPQCSIGAFEADAVVCVGDCNASDSVTADELVNGVNIALGNATLDRCQAFDCNGNGHVTVDCLVRAVKTEALFGMCPCQGSGCR